MDGLSEVGPKDERATGADGKIIKMEEDYSERVAEAIPKAEQMAKSKKLTEAIDLLYSLEKGSRQGGDAPSNRKLLLAIIKLCHDAGEWKLLNEHLQTLSKKRGLIKNSITNMVKEAAGYVEELEAAKNEPAKLDLIHTLRTITEGKIYVEVERARLTYKLAMMKEREKNDEEACKLLLDLQVETFGSMERSEKVDLLLEQMRLCLKQSDFVRAQVISRKISTKFFESEDKAIQAMKIKFYKQMIQLDRHEGRYLDIARHFLALYATPQVKEDRNKADEALKSALLFAILAPYSNEQWDLLHRIKSERALEKLPHYKGLADLLTTEEMIAWKGQIEEKLEATLRRGPAVTTVFSNPADGNKLWDVFAQRVGEHNIRIISKYYTRIGLERMAALLGWTVDKTEDFLCKLVVDGTIPSAKIDRLSGVVCFQAPPSSTELMDEWSGNLKNLLDILNKVSHLIQKEEMVHEHLHQRVA